MGNVWRITSFSEGKERGSMVGIKGGPRKIDYRLGEGESLEYYRILGLISSQQNQNSPKLPLPDDK